MAKQYGLSSIDILAKKAREIFAIYFIVIFISVLGEVLDVKVLESVTPEIAAIPINVTSVRLGIQVTVVIFSAYFFLKYLLEIFRISPEEVMKTLGYTDEIVKFIRKGELQIASIKLSKGLSLIRGCIMDLSLRDDLERVVSTFTDVIKRIPSEGEKGKDEKKKNDINTLVLNLHLRIDESIFDPLLKTDLKPDVRIFSQLFENFAKVYIDSGLLNSSLFDEYLDRISKVTIDYVNSGKREALNSFFFSVLWMFDKSPDKITDMNVSKVLSKGIVLSASLIKLLERKLEKTDDIEYVLFVTSSYIRDWLCKYPGTLAGLDVDDLVYLVEKGGKLFIGNIVIALFCVENELERIKETKPGFIYRWTAVKFEKVKLKVKEILLTNGWRIFVENSSLNVLDINDKTIGAIKIENILSPNGVGSLRLFIQRYLT